MAGISSQKELEEFLKTRPRKNSIAIASRVALRVTPFLVSFDLQSDRYRGMYLSCLRASSISWAAMRMAGQEIERAAAADAYAAAYANADVAADAYAAAAASANAAVSAASANAAVSASAIAAASSAAAAAAAIFVFDILPSVNADIQALLNKQNLAEAPLWPDGIPPEIEEKWQELKLTLLSFPDENWQVWTDWYEARLKGAPFTAELEKTRALLPNELWKKGPKEVNAEIARLIEEHSAPKLPPDLTAPINCPCFGPKPSSLDEKRLQPFFLS
jgi:hypothetical protein